MRLAALLLAAGAAMLGAQQYRAFWADSFHAGYKTPAQVDKMVDDVAAAKCNAVFIQVRRYADAYHREALEPPVEDAAYQPGFDALEYLIEKAHARGIEVHAWFVVGRMWVSSRPPADPRHIWHSHGPAAPPGDMWLTVASSGETAGFVDYGHPAALAHLAGVLTDPLRHYELDGIHLDYIRYLEGPRAGVSYGWNPVAVERFNRLHNRTGTPAEGDAVWSDFRRRQVSALVRQVYLRTQELRPATKVSAALITWGNGPESDEEFRRGSAAWNRIFQDWPGWLAEGIIDLGMPMNYFDENRYASWLDRWLAFEKDRQGRRALLPGLAIYLNTIPNSLAQTERVLAPSAAGNTAPGVVFYSYASTNTLNSAGAPVRPNAEFYEAVAERFREPAMPPALPWKTAPERGHALGVLDVDGGAPWLKDGVTAWLESDTGRDPARRAVTDGSGFFGFADVPPGRYRVRLERAGRELFRTIGQEIAAGTAARFDLFLKAADFATITPRIVAAGATAAAPGDLVTIEGAAFAVEPAAASAVPLPFELGRTQVVVNGVAAPLSYVTPGRIEFQSPFLPAPSWSVLVRHDGMESALFELRAVEANPRILGVRRAGDRYLEIYLTGLGMLDPPLPAGAGAPFTRLALPLEVTVSDVAATVFYAGLAPYQPYLYQVNVELPPGVSGGTLRLQIGSASASTSVWADTTHFQP